MTQDTQNVPHWFADFAVKNADEHAALAKEIANVAVKNAEEHGALAREIAKNSAEIAKAEIRTTRWTAIVVLGGLTVAVSILSAVTILAN